MTPDFVVYADGGRRTREAHERKNKARVFLDGEYIGQAHTLGISPGRYTSDRLNAILNTDYRKLDRVHDLIAAGYVYVIWNKAWPEWVKVGMTTDPTRRLTGYQTGSPLRDYEVLACAKVPDRAAAEALLLDDLSSHGERQGEWLRVDRHFACQRLAHFFQTT